MKLNFFFRLNPSSKVNPNKPFKFKAPILFDRRANTIFQSRFFGKALFYQESALAYLNHQTHNKNCVGQIMKYIQGVIVMLDK